MYRLSENTGAWPMKRSAMAAAIVASMLGGVASGQDSALENLRAVAIEVSGIPLPAMAAGMLASEAGNQTVVIHPGTNQVLIWNEQGRLTDWGVMIRDTRSDLVAVEFDSGRRVVLAPAALLRAIGTPPLPGEIVPAAACLDRLAISGGTVISESGPLRPGWRVESNRYGRAIVTGEGRAGSWVAAGTEIGLQTGAGIHYLECNEVSAALAEAPPTSAEAARSLTTLILVLEDGNTVLDRLSEYQRNLSALANSSVSEAAAARRPVSDCRRLATLSVICDRLTATFRQP